MSTEKLTHNPCCSSHGVSMDCEKYRRTHFVEVGPCCSIWAEEHPEYGTAAEPTRPEVDAPAASKTATAELNIPDEAVQLAAEQIRAVAASCCRDAALAANVAGSAEDWMGEAQAALAAAAPLIVAPFESKLTAVWVLAERAERKGCDLDAAEVLAALWGESR